MADTPAKNPAKSRWSIGGKIADLISFSTVKKAPRADPSTESTQSAHHRQSPRRPEIRLTSPSKEQENGFENSSNGISNGNYNTSSAIDLLDTQTTSPVARLNGFGDTYASAQVSMVPPAKSPWRSISSISSANNAMETSIDPVQFSLGNLKPAASEGRGLHPPRNGRGFGRKKKFTKSKFLTSRKTREGKIDPDFALNALRESRGLFMSNQIASTATIRPGRRLHGTNQRGGSRLALAEPESVSGVKQARDEFVPAEERAAKRTKVTFGDAASNDAVVTDVVTPKKQRGSQRTATPYRPARGMDIDQDDDDDDGDDDSPPELSPWYDIEGPPFPENPFSDIPADELGPPQTSNADTFSDSKVVNFDVRKKETRKGFEASTKPGLMKKDQGNVETQSNDFFDSVANDYSAEAKSEGWGNLFDRFKVKGSWKCEQCTTLNNDPNAYACVSCETPRSGDAQPTKKTKREDAKTSIVVGAGGFTFGGATGGGENSAFVFGAAKSSSAADDKPAGGGFQFDTGNSTGGFTFGQKKAGDATAPAPAPVGGFTFEPKKTHETTSSAPASGFSFGATKSDSAAAPAPAGAIKFGSSTQTSSPKNDSSASGGTSKFGSAPNDASSSATGNSAGALKPIGFSFATAPAPAPVGDKPFKFSVSDDEKKSEDSAKVPAFSFGTTTPAPKVAAEAPKTEPAAKRTKPEGFSAPPAPNSAGKAESKTSVRFRFGETPPAPATGSTPVFGLSSDDATARTSALSSGEDEDQRKKRRHRDDNSALAPSTLPTFGAASDPAPKTPSFSFGQKAETDPTTASLSFAGSSSGPFSFGKKPSNDESKAPAPTAPSFGVATTPAPSDKSAVSAPAFGQATAPATESKSATTGSTFGSTPAPSFGSTPTPAAPNPAFTSTAAPAPATTFGNTPAQPTFGSTPAPTFGSTPAPTPAVPAFGSTPATAPGPTFGSTPAAPPAFGSTAASSTPSFGSGAPPAFASTPAPASTGFGGPAPSVFGSTPAPAPAAFGAAPAPFAAAPAPFGSAPAPFGAPAPAPAFGGGFGGAQGAPAPAQFGAPSGGFGGGFGGAPAAPPAPGGFGAPAPGGFGAPAPGASAGGAPQFNIGTSGNTSTRGRRVVRARRPRRQA